MFSHGIMFHHFYDGNLHIKGQGAITAEELESLLNFYQKDHKVISANEYSEKAKNGQLREEEVCITFDDALKCQYDVAYPVLESRGLKAFWFIYTSPFVGVLEKMEIYRHFRFNSFADFDEFYSAFFALAYECKKELNCNVKEALRDFQPDEYLKACPFYTVNDKKFRYLRDCVLKEEKYNFLMDKMIEKYHYNVAENAKKLWLSEENVKEMHRAGHIIGLHSHTHPMVMADKDFDGQYQEYGKNKEILEGIIGEKVDSVSYPCSSYDEITLEIMKKLQITLGFLATMEKPFQNQLEIPRMDHTNIMKRMLQK